jgi:DNA (cytosine-5)-methyltransferase 1
MLDFIVNNKINKMNGLSLFSNIGIGESFLHKNNIHIKVANEIIPKRCKIYSQINPNSQIIMGDIQDTDIFNKIIISAKENNCEFIIATPPCQGMSVAGQRIKNDKRNGLIKYVVNAINIINPKYALIENVPTLENTNIDIDNQKIKIIDFIKRSLTDYKINIQVLNCAEYGIPQNRKRIFILLSRKDVIEWDFKLLKEQKITVKDVIDYLPSLEAGQKSNIPYHYAIEHNEKHILWMKHTPSAKTAFDNLIFYPNIDGRKIKAYRSSYRRINWDKPAPTITTNSNFISSQNKVHPGRPKGDGTYTDARCLTPLEIILLTGLDIEWRLPDWVGDKLLREVIGESVPPKIIYELTKVLKNVT